MCRINIKKKNRRKKIKSGTRVKRIKGEYRSEREGTNSLVLVRKESKQKEEEEEEEEVME